MRISGPIDARGALVQRQGKVEQGAVSFRLGSEPVVNGSGMTSSVSGLSSVSALIALQDVTEIARERRKAKAKSGFRLVEGLDTLKLALLSGQIDADQLNDLELRLSGTDSDAKDPELGPILRAIRVRARVELAKLGR